METYLDDIARKLRTYRITYVKQKSFHEETEREIKYLKENCRLQYLFSVHVVFFILQFIEFAWGKIVY
jgi:hypothetical protein